MYLYRKRQDIKTELAKRKAKVHHQERGCPECHGILQLIESGKDRDTYFCGKCNTTHTFTMSPFDKPKDKVKKLGAISLRDRSSTKSKVEISIPEEPDPNVLDTIGKAMENKNLLTFEYIAHNKKTFRTIEPYKLTRATGGELILFGYCLEGEGIRMFKLARMNGLASQEYQFKPRCGWEIQNKLKKDGTKKKKDKKENTN